MARRQDQTKPGNSGLQVRPARRCQALIAGAHASKHHHRGVGRNAHLPAKNLDFDPWELGPHALEFGVAGDMHRGLIRSELPQAVRVLPVLRTYGRKRAENRPPEPLHPAVPPEMFIADASVEHRHRDAPPARSPYGVGPHFGLEQHQQARPETLQKAADAHPVIERKPRHGDGPGRLLGLPPARQRRCGQEDGYVRPARRHRLEYGPRRINLAHAARLHPDGRAIQPRRNRGSETAQQRPVFRPYRQIGRPGRRGKRRQHVVRELR